MYTKTQDEYSSREPIVYATAVPANTYHPSYNFPPQHVVAEATTSTLSPPSYNPDYRPEPNQMNANVYAQASSPIPGSNQYSPPNMAMYQHGYTNSLPSQSPPIVVVQGQTTDVNNNNTRYSNCSSNGSGRFGFNPHGHQNCHHPWQRHGCSPPSYQRHPCTNRHNGQRYNYNQQHNHSHNNRASSSKSDCCGCTDLGALLCCYPTLCCLLPFCCFEGFGNAFEMMEGNFGNDD